jgi:hypothetical protein
MSSVLVDLASPGEGERETRGKAAATIAIPADSGACGWCNCLQFLQGLSIYKGQR